MGDPPIRIGPYRILGKLGEGGMGTVYEATDAATDDATGQKVAIKILHAEYAKSEEFLGRFFNEARAVSQVNHLGLVQVSEHGALPDGTAYIVMELLRGESLGLRLKRTGALPIGDVLRLGALIADSLAAAHDKGIVHRDLKPENIMIVADPAVPGGERTKLLDFGIAKLTDGQDFVKTRTNAMLGTPIYMSPEQCRGAGKVDDRADAYSFGVMLFVMVAGRPPFLGEGMGDIIGKHMYEAPPPLESFAPDVVAPLADLVARLLVKDKQLRPPMREIAVALEDMAKQLPSLPKKTSGSGPISSPLLSLPTLAGQSQTTELTRGGTRQRRTAATLLTFVALSGILVLALYKFLPRPPPRAVPTVPMVPAAARPSETPSVLPPPQPPASAPLPKVQWRISSTPPGASVTRESDGKLLCQTPCAHEQAAGPDRVELRLRRDGYADRVVQVFEDKSAQISETLVPIRRVVKGKPLSKPVASPSVAEPASPTPAKPAKPEPPGNPVHARPKIED